jgi:2-dehydropantoate 2-reductase
MRILIFGAGAVGQALGCILSANGHSVHLVARHRFIDTVRDSGITVTGIFGDFHTEPDRIGISETVNDVCDVFFDYIIVTTKSYDTIKAAEELKKLTKPFTPVSMQNGCGNLEILEKSFGSEKTLGARVITGFEIINPGVIKITVSADKIHIGGVCGEEIPESASVLAEAINNSGIPCEATKYIRRDLFAKLLYNSALNPLGAILGVHYGSLGDNQETRKIMNNVIHEVFAVITAMGEKTHWDTPEDYIEYFYGHQIPATYNHRPSMLQDIENGKRTEIDSLTGYVTAQGKLLGVQVPVCETLSGIVRFMEKISLNSVHNK